MNNIIVVGENTLNASIEGESYEVINNTLGHTSIKHEELGFVLVSDFAGNARYSYNGKKWISVTIPSHTTMYYLNNKIILLDGSNIHISVFPFNWVSTTFTLPENDFFCNVCYGSQGFIFVSTTGIIKKSLLGVTWESTIIASYTTNYNSRLIYFNGNYILVNVSSITVEWDTTTSYLSYISVDGLNWNSFSCNLPNIFSNYENAAIDFEYRTRIFINNNILYTSFKGTWNNGQQPYLTYLYSSLDGITWELPIVEGVTSYISLSTFAWEGDKYFCKDYFIKNNFVFILIHYRHTGGDTHPTFQFLRIFDLNAQVVSKEFDISDNIPSKYYYSIVEGFPGDFWTNFINTTEGLI